MCGDDFKHTLCDGVNKLPCSSALPFFAKDCSSGKISECLPDHFLLPDQLRCLPCIENRSGYLASCSPTEVLFSCLFEGVGGLPKVVGEDGSYTASCVECPENATCNGRYVTGC